jgi:hypothetical protein
MERRSEFTTEPLPQQRPQTRGECSSVPRPCPFVSCRYNLSLEVTNRGTIVYNWVNKEGDLDPVSNCALDHADKGEMPLEVLAQATKLHVSTLYQVGAKGLKRVHDMRALGPVHPNIPRYGDGTRAKPPSNPKKSESVRVIERLIRRQKRLRLVEPEPPSWRPRVRADCAKVPRPCPYVGCSYNTSIDMTDTGALRFRSIDKEGQLDPGARNCALDFAEEGGMTLEEIAQLFGITRERIRQLEHMALAKLRQNAAHLAPESDSEEELH